MLLLHIFVNTKKKKNNMRKFRSENSREKKDTFLLTSTWTKFMKYNFLSKKQFFEFETIWKKVLSHEKVLKLNF